MSTEGQAARSEAAMSTKESERSMELREHDVVCEKGRGDHERWPGNKLYRYLINMHKERYNDLTPMERSAVIGKIISSIKEKDGWFVQRDEKSGKWGELTEEKVRKKVSDDLRREVRRRREKRSNNSMFSAKLKALKEMQDEVEPVRDILQPVNDPRQTDVLFGPGARRHPGNKTYWRLMKMNLDHYIISPYGARSMISRSIVQGIRDQNGRFLEQDPKTAIWYEISDKRAIEKTSHALSNKKYKTRKRHPEEQGSQHPFKGYQDLDDEASECFSEKSSDSPSHESDDSIQSRAKKLSKKFRLMKRMDGPELEDEDKESIPHAANILCSGFPRRTDPLVKKLGTPISPPRTEAKGHPDDRVIISPNDSRSSISEGSRDEYHEFEDSHGYRRHHKRGPPVLDGPEMRDYAVYRKTDIEPRVNRYEAYVDEERYRPDRLFKSSQPSSFAGHVQEYTSVRRYMDRGIPPPPNRPPMEPEYMSPRARQGPAPALHSPYNGVIPPPRRRVLESRGSSGYFVHEWGSPTSGARHADEYNNSWH